MEKDSLILSKIYNYESEVSSHNKNKYIHLTIIIISIFITSIGIFFTWILFLIGYFLFIKRIKTKRKLDYLKQGIIEELNALKKELTIEEYFEYLKRIKLAF